MDADDQAWWAAEERAIRLHLAGRTRNGVEELSEYLDTHPDSRHLVDAIGARAELSLSLGDLAAAQQGFEEVCRLSSATYGRFVAEFALASIVESLGDTKGAIDWYLAALRTALEEGKTSTGGVLMRLFKIAPVDQLPAQARAIIDRSIVGSWTFLKMKGEPDLSAPAKAAEAILQESSRPR